MKNVEIRPSTVFLTKDKWKPVFEVFQQVLIEFHSTFFFPKKFKQTGKRKERENLTKKEFSDGSTIKPQYCH